MNALDRLLIAAAVTISPAAHRETRREQWAADVQGAAELDLSPTALAFGAFTTALFHRRADRRTTWGTAMTAAPLDVRPEPHRIRTVPVLVAVAVVSLLAAGAWLILQPNGGYDAVSDRVLASIGLWSLVFVVPGIAIALAALVLPTSPTRRRLGASMVLTATAVAVAYPFTTIPGAMALSFLPMLVALAGWLVAVRVPAWTWVFAAVPVLAWYLGWSGALYALLPVRWTPFLVGVPYLALILAGFVASRFSTDRRRRFVAAEGALVDKSA
ncbi:MAG: hypothetical protein V4755_11870 [Curtobacterium sp.]